MSECSEVAETLPLPEHPITFSEASAIVRANLGSPDEVGYVIFDNIASALAARSKR